eukprot:3284150-Rhodomonas_salina.1
MPSSVPQCLLRQQALRLATLPMKAGPAGLLVLNLLGTIRRISPQMQHSFLLCWIIAVAA